MSGLQFHIPLPGFDSEVVQPTETYQAPIKEGSYFFTPAFTEADLDEDGNPPPPFSVVNGQVFCELVNFSKHKRKVRRVTDQSTGTFKLHKVACAFCRTRKLKCRGFPVCSSCKSRKRVCQFCHPRPSGPKVDLEKETPVSNVQRDALVSVPSTAAPRIPNPSSSTPSIGTFAHEAILGETSTRAMFLDYFDTTFGAVTSIKSSDFNLLFPSSISQQLLAIAAYIPAALHFNLWDPAIILYQKVQSLIPLAFERAGPEAVVAICVVSFFNHLVHSQSTGNMYSTMASNLMSNIKSIKPVIRKTVHMTKGIIDPVDLPVDTKPNLLEYYWFFLSCMDFNIPHPDPRSSVHILQMSLKSYHEMFRSTFPSLVSEKGCHAVCEGHPQCANGCVIKEAFAAFKAIAEVVKNDISPLNPNYIADGTRMRLSVLFVKWILKDFNGATGEAEFYLNSMKESLPVLVMTYMYRFHEVHLFIKLFVDAKRSDLLNDMTRLIFTASLIPMLNPLANRGLILLKAAYRALGLSVPILQPLFLIPAAAQVPMTQGDSFLQFMNLMKAVTTHENTLLNQIILSSASTPFNASKPESTSHPLAGMGDALSTVPSRLSLTAVPLLNPLPSNPVELSYTMQDQLCIEQTLYEPFGPAPTPVVKSYEEFAKDEEDLAFFIPAVPF